MRLRHRPQLHKTGLGQRINRVVDLLLGVRDVFWCDFLLELSKDLIVNRLVLVGLELTLCLNVAAVLVKPLVGLGLRNVLFD